MNNEGIINHIISKGQFVKRETTKISRVQMVHEMRGDGGIIGMRNVFSRQTIECF